MRVRTHGGDKVTLGTTLTLNMINLCEVIAQYLMCINYKYYIL